MAKGINNAVEAHEVEPVSLSELIHQHVRVAIQTAVHEELRAALAATRRIRGALQPLLKAPLVRPTRASNAHGASVALTRLREGGDELLTFFTCPQAQWKALRSTNVIERLHQEFRRRVKTQGSLPNEDAALVLLFSLVASG